MRNFPLGIYKDFVLHLYDNSVKHYVLIISLVLI